jgi:hypothetical protein
MSAMSLPAGAASGLIAVVDSLIALDGDSPLVLDAIRIASVQASARGAFRPATVALVDAAALLAFDRSRARRDVARLIADAERGDGDVLQVLSQWRSERRFLVERPLLSEVPAAPRRVVARVPGILAAIERAALGDSARGDAVPLPTLSRGASAAMSLLISVRTRPPQPQVRLGVMEARSLSSNRSVVYSPRAARLLNGATNEESLVMAVADVHGDSLLTPVVLAAALLSSQGLRTVAQEAPYHPGMLSLTASQIVERFGLGSLTFGRDVPVSWQPYYLREFAQAIDAIRSVFPQAEFVGLNVRIGDRVREGSLAVHDPRTRTLTLPVATGFGALGHELMHDLDWQSARDYANRTGTYATDDAWRGRRSQPLAAPLARLAESAPTSGLSAAAEREARRPAELLARGADWFIATALARRGRVNGVLTAVQDGWIRGYASATGPQAFGDNGAALAALLDQMPMLVVRADVSPRTDAERSPDLGAIVRAAWTVRLPEVETSAEGIASGARGAPLNACSPVTRLRLAPVRQAAREMTRAVIEARARRALRRWAVETPPGALRDADIRWLQAAELGAPIDPIVVAPARARWLATASQALPCLSD